MRKADSLPSSCAVVRKSANLNFLELSESVMGLLYLTFTNMHYDHISLSSS